MAIPRFRLFLSTALALLASAGSLAAGPYVGNFDATALLPPPPALHDGEDSADRDEAFRVYSERTHAELSLGKAEHKVTLAAFGPAIGPDYRPGRYPLLEALIVAVDADTKRVVDAAKNHWGRPRPFIDDPVRFAHPGDIEKNAGYPSGHSTRGTVFALILAEVFPERREAILEKGRLIGWTRVEIGVHTPLDIYAGRVLGRALAREFLADPAFQADLAAAKAEVAAAR
jgi:acid phosphatase (class A)